MCPERANESKSGQAVSSLLSFDRLQRVESQGLLCFTSLLALPIKPASSECMAGAEWIESVAQFSGGMKGLLGRRASLMVRKKDPKKAILYYLQIIEL